MKERERVFELVKQGIITTEEALVLLENMATEKDEKIVKKEALDVKKGPSLKATVETPREEAAEKPFSEADLFEDEKDLAEAEEEAFEKLEENEAKDHERLEKILDELATEANKASAELDEVNLEIQGLKTQIKEKEEELMVLNTLEELDELTPEKIEERTAIETEIANLNRSLVELEVEQADFEGKLKNIRKEQKDSSREQWAKKFEIPEDWEDNLNEFGQKMGEAGTSFGRKMGEAGSQLGRFMKETIRTVTDNVDWKDMNIKVPGVVSNSFSHEFYYPETLASLIDVKVANGEVKFSTWEGEDLKVEADIKLYGKMDAETPFEAFLERSEIDVNEERISFQIPNKRVKADLHFFLPVRVYDHISVKLLNGDVSVENLEAKDLFIKSTNGDMSFNNLTATMLEVEGVNGDVTLLDSQVMDFIAESVNGDFTLQANIENSNISNVNGDIKITAQAENLKKIEAQLVNGTIKVALPTGVSLEGLVKTSLGSIKNRLTDYEVIREKTEKTNQMLQFRRYEETETAYVRLSTTTGSVYLKDTDQ